MNVEFNASDLQIWKNPSGEIVDYDICFSRDGVYVTIGLSEELVETLREWLNNYQSSRGKANE